MHPRSLTRSLVALALAALAACGGSTNATHTSAPPPPPADGADAGVSPPPTDPQPATPQLAGPANGAIVAGAVGLSANVPAATAKVEFDVDGAAIATVSAPFVVTWDSYAAANGAHTLLARAIASNGAATPSSPVQVTVSNHIKTVFVILMENHDWSEIKGSALAPYINGTLLTAGAHAEKYMNVPGLHPSLPNYLWLESGGTQGVSDDAEPPNHRLSGQHLVSLLKAAGVTWKSYQEDIGGADCPLTAVNLYAPKHNPMVYFQDVNGGVSRTSSECISHVRPYSELTNDLEGNTVAAYNFITPNICNDMHDCGIDSGDAWLAREVPKILGSRAYKEGGALFVTWDESEGSDVPIGMIALSPLIKPGYSNTISYTHSSTLRTVQEIFAVTPFLGDAANATDLRDLFRSFP